MQYGYIKKKNYNSFHHFPLISKCVEFISLGTITKTETKFCSFQRPWTSKTVLKSAKKYKLKKNPCRHFPKTLVQCAKEAKKEIVYTFPPPPSSSYSRLMNVVRICDWHSEKYS